MAELRIITTEEKDKLEDNFRKRCIVLGIKHASSKYYNLQVEWVVAMSTTLELLGIQYPPYWYICTSCGREIIEPYKLN